jgi:crossover junction endodeoxyribonuclease RuvC
MLKLGRAQGVAMAAALHKEVPVFEYAPRRIKQSVTGAGGAAKEQVAAMLKSMLGIEYNPKRLDATDGLAVTISSPHHPSPPPPAPRRAAAKVRAAHGRSSWHATRNGRLKQKNKTKHIINQNYEKNPIDRSHGRDALQLR